MVGGVSGADADHLAFGGAKTRSGHEVARVDRPRFVEDRPSRVGDVVRHPERRPFVEKPTGATTRLRQPIVPRPAVHVSPADYDLEAVGTVVVAMRPVGRA